MKIYKGWRIIPENNGYRVMQSARMCAIFGTSTLFRAKSIETCMRWIDEAAV